MPIRMIVTDLDCTLLADDKTLPAYTAEVLQRCRAGGIKLAYATGRSLHMVRALLPLCPADAVIVDNGAAAYEGDTRIREYSIPIERVRNCLLRLRRELPRAMLAVEIGGAIYSHFDIPETWRFVEFRKSDFTDLPDLPAGKIIAVTPSPKDLQLLEPYTPEGCYFEIIEGYMGVFLPREATKWQALQQLAARLDIPPAEIAAFGDDLNDLDMLRHCGVGVAVENALDQAKAVADHICGMNMEEGVARWIEANIL